MIDILDWQVLLGLLADGSHSLYCLNRVLTSCRLTRKHDAVSAVVDCVSNVRNFCTGWARVTNHRIKHLSCGDDRLVSIVALLDDSLLDVRNLSCRNLNAKVTTGNHDAVRSCKNLVKVLYAKSGLNLREDLYVRSAHLTANVTNLLNCSAVTNEGGSNCVNTKLATKHDVCAVLLSDGRKANVDVRNVYALLLAKLTTVDDLAVHVGALNVINLKTNEAVINKDDRALLDLFWKILVVKREALSITNDIIIGGYNDGLTSSKGDLLAILEKTGANLRSLCIKHDSNRNTKLIRDRTNATNHSAVILMATVREVKTCDVHASKNELTKNLITFCSRTHSTNNLGLFASHISPFHRN